MLIRFLQEASQKSTDDSSVLRDGGFSVPLDDKWGFEWHASPSVSQTAIHNNQPSWISWIECYKVCCLRTDWLTYWKSQLSRRMKVWSGNFSLEGTKCISHNGIGFFLLFFILIKHRDRDVIFNCHCILEMRLCFNVKDVSTNSKTRWWRRLPNHFQEFGTALRNNESHYTQMEKTLNSGELLQEWSVYQISPVIRTLSTRPKRRSQKERGKHLKPCRLYL